MVVAVGTCKLKLMYRSDFADVLRIERACFDNPWTEADFLDHLRSGSALGFVALDRDKVVGFCIYEIVGAKIVINNMAVDPDYQCQYIGKSLMNDIKRYMIAKRYQQIETYVVESNLGAQQFFRACHFRCIAALPGYYLPESEEAAYRFVFSI